MNIERDKLWITVCLGVVTIASATVAAAFFSAGLADLATSATDIRGFVLVWCRLIGVLYVVAIYWAMIRHAEAAMFSSELDLARTGTNRKEAVRLVYQGLFLIFIGLVLVVALNAVEDLAGFLNRAPMAPMMGD